MFHNVFIKMNKKVNYAYQYLSRTETILASIKTLKGTAEFAAAVAALVEYLQNLL